MALPHSHLPGRRRFLFAAGATAVGSLPMVRIAHACSSRTARLGVVLPYSHRYPELPREFLAGFTDYAASAAAHGRIEIVPIACAANGAPAALAAAVRATECRAVDVVAGLAGAELAARMAPALETGAVPFVACDLGADFVRVRRDSPLLLRHSLGYWQANYAMGTWAAGHLGRRVLIAADFLESGYDVVYAFRRAFEAAGGEVVGLARTGLPDGTGTLPEVAAAVRSTVPDFVYAFYSGKRAQAFLDMYQAEDLARVAPLAGAALLTERSGRAGFEGILTVASWTPDTAGPFHELGRDAARRVSAELEGSLGTALGDPATAAYVRRRTRTATGLAEVVVERLPAIALSGEIRRELRAIPKTGWSQAYLTA